MCENMHCCCDCYPLVRQHYPSCPTVSGNYIWHGVVAPCWCVAGGTITISNAMGTGLGWERPIRIPY